VFTAPQRCLPRSSKKTPSVGPLEAYKYVADPAPTELDQRTTRDLAALSRRSEKNGVARKRRNSVENQRRRIPPLRLTISASHRHQSLAS
jgi:hypothetical protein